MKKTHLKPKHEGNLVLAYDRDKMDPRVQLFLGLKPPKTDEDFRRKRKRIGADCWVPSGGARELYDKTHKHGAQRELWEESDKKWKVPLGSLRQVALLDGFFTAKPGLGWARADFVWQVYVYETVIQESLRDTFGCGPGFAETAWHPVQKLPFQRMIDSDKLWIPRVIKGEHLKIRFLYNSVDDTLLEHDITPIAFR